MMIDTTIRLLPASPSCSPLWAQRFDRASKSKNPLKAAMLNIFCERLKLHAPALWAGETGLNLSEDESDAILSELEKGLDFFQQQITQNAFREGLSIGNGPERWHIALPPLRQMVAHYANQIKPQHVVLLMPFNRIMNSFIERLADVFDSEPAELAGAILFSAAACDGLVDFTRMEALAKIDISAISIDNGICLVDLGDAGAWLPGALSQSLIICYQRRIGLPLCACSGGAQESPDTTAKPVNLTAALHALGLFLPDLTTNDRDLLKERIPALCRAYHGTVFPGYLLSYIHGVNQSSSLSTERYREIFAGTRYCSTVCSGPVRRAIAASHLDRYQGHRELQMQSIRRLIETLESPSISTPKDAQAAIAALVAPEDRWPIQKLMGEWVIARIDEMQKKDGEPSSLLRYYQSLWWPLFISAKDEDPRQMSENRLVEWIDTALASHYTEHSQLYFQQQIGSFLRFLSSKYRVPKIDFGDLDCWISDATYRVNNNWITPREFDQIIKLLRGNTIVSEPWLREVCILVARICYRGGTRRLEPLQALIRDLQVSKTPELLIREGLLGTLKSDQAERRIPIFGLFPEAEAQGLLDYHRRRLLVSSTDAPLFSSPSAPDQPLNADRVYRYITKAMKLATGRDDDVVHLLRHGCANNTLIQLEIADGTIELPKGLDAFSHPNFSRERCAAVKNALFLRRLGDSLDTGERNLFALALLLGHLSPATTMKSYQHMMDFLVHLHARAAQPVIRDYRAIAAAIGIRKSQIYNIAKAYKIPAEELTLEGVLPELQRRHSEGLTRSEGIHQATSGLPPDPSP